MKIVTYVIRQRTFNQKSYCKHDIFSEIRTAHFEIPTTHFVLRNTILGTGPAVGA